MKKKILIFFSFVLVFCFLFSVPAFALYDSTTISINDSDDSLYFSQTYLGYEFYRLECNGISYYHTNELTVSSSGSNSVYFIIFPLGIYEFNSSSASDSHYITINDDKRYKLYIDFSVYFDDVYSSSYSLSSIYWNSTEEPLPDLERKNNNSSVSFSSVFTTQNVCSTQLNYSVSEFDNYPGVYFSGTCLGFKLNDIPTSDSCRIVINTLSISIYDPNSSFIDYDYGYTAPDNDVNNFSNSFTEIIGSANTMLTNVVNFSDNIGVNFDEINLKLSGFKTNILTPIYDLFPDWLTLILVFAVCLVIVRKAVGR